MKTFLTTMLCTLVLCSSFAEAQDRENDLGAALDHLDAGIAQLQNHDERSGQTLEESAAMLQAVIDTHGYHTPKVYHALGNAYMLSDKLGLAIAAYRQGEQLDPRDVPLRESLAYARSQVPIKVEKSITSRAWTVVLGWRGYIERSWLWISFAGLFTIGWLARSAATLRLIPRAAKPIGVWMILLGFVPLTMLGLEWTQHQGNHAVVIVGDDVLARSGPDDQIYDPIFSEQLRAGIEGELLETRDGWNRIELADGSECWLPQQSMVEVNAKAL
tara:strand:+ start:119454 stop:120272 length:819 start_codon:yes stop_codon:yes gene_type:complete